MIIPGWILDPKSPQWGRARMGLAALCGLIGIYLLFRGRVGVGLLGIGIAALIGGILFKDQRK